LKEIPYDKLMKRTANRPLPTETLNSKQASIFGYILVVAALALLFYFSWKSAALGFLSYLLYGYVYTPLKRVGPISVFVGAFPGAFPPMIGWVAATGHFGWEPGILFAIQFFWQFPHFWAIAWLADEDYKNAGFKLLPSKDGEKDENVSLKLIDFENPENNEFLVVSQLWIQSTGRTPHCAYRRPDLILYVNGLPLVFIELKNSNVKLKNAFDDNLKNYKNDIPQLFLTNAFCVLSNATDTKLGSFTAEWEHFFNWLRVDHEKEKVNKEEIEEQGTSIEYLLRGLCRPERLLDYIENFILFQNEKHRFILFD
jgi:hypothetical protein